MQNTPDTMLLVLLISLTALVSTATVVLIIATICELKDRRKNA